MQSFQTSLRSAPAKPLRSDLIFVIQKRRKIEGGAHNIACAHSVCRSRTGRLRLR
jgi:hypothetical protein